MAIFAMLIIINFSQPITLIMILILVTVILAFKSFMITSISLFSYMILLAILGGLIILFIYMASLAPNEKFPTKFSPYMFMTIMITSFILELLLSLYFQNIEAPQSAQSEINSIMNYPLLMTMIATYLIMTLIAVVKITNFKKGPLRSI